MNQNGKEIIEERKMTGRRREVKGKEHQEKGNENSRGRKDNGLGEKKKKGMNQDVDSNSTRKEGRKRIIYIFDCYDTS